MKEHLLQTKLFLYGTVFGVCIEYLVRVKVSIYPIVAALLMLVLLIQHLVNINKK